jgi:lysine-N-methylase
MAANRSLPVLMPAVPGQRWSCHSCGDCCHTLVGHLFDEERRQIDEQGWANKLGVAPYVRIGREWVLNKRDDGACVFLDEHNRCRIHSEFGEQAKPLACRIFPFSVRPTPRGWQASLRFDCPSVIASKGRGIPEHRDWLAGLVRELDRRRRRDADDHVELARGVPGEPREVDALLARLMQWLRAPEHPLLRRVLGAVRLTATLHEANLAKVRGDRFIDLLDLLFGSLPGSGTAIPAEPTLRQLGMLRQLAFAHTEHVTLADLRAGVLSRARRRCHQLRDARRWRKGAGLVPALGRGGRSTTFDQVERVTPDSSIRPEMEDLLLRYITARVEGRSVFGEGYYCWPVVSGLAALWLSIAVAGWLARYAAATDSRPTFHRADLGWGIGIVDRAATRLPALGTLAERARASYLLRDDGVARLLQRFTPIGGSQ